MAPRILFIDDDPQRHRDFHELQPQAVCVSSASAAVTRLQNYGPWDLIFLDGYLSPRGMQGWDVVREMIERRVVVKCVVCHSTDDKLGERMATELRLAGYAAVARPEGWRYAKRYLQTLKIHDPVKEETHV